MSRFIIEPNGFDGGWSVVDTGLTSDSEWRVICTIEDKADSELVCEALNEWEQRHG